MKVKITRETFVRGELAKPGDVYDDLPDRDANSLVSAGKAVRVTDKVSTASASSSASGSTEKNGLFDKWKK